MSKPNRKKITKLGWGVKWSGGKIEFFKTKELALSETISYAYNPSSIFRCKIEEITK